MPDSRMFSLPIVVHFDVLKDSGCCHAPSCVTFPVNELNFQRMEETFHRSIVIAIGSAAHAAVQAIVLDQSLISF